MSVATKFLGLLNGALTLFAPVTSSAGSASAGGVVGLGTDGRLDNTLFKQPAVVAYASTMTLDLAANSDIVITLTGPLTLANPTSLTPGNAGLIILLQGGSGSNLLSACGTSFQFPGGTLPVLSTTVGSKDTFSYKVQSATEILVTPGYGFAHT